jgi:phage N-6-adenine-methyltransferase
VSLVQVPRGDLEHYDPEKGLKTIAVAETAERHYRRAKDATRLLEAVELKLTEQQRFVRWWDTQAKQAGARTPRGYRSETPSLDTLGVDKITVHRWRTRLKDDAAFQATLALAQARCVKIVESYRGGLPEDSRSLGTGEYEWYTPAEYVAAARDVLGAIDLDPASSEAAQRTVQAARYFSKQDDGLTHEWHGRIWLNPPYAAPLLSYFVDKLIAEYQARRTTAALLLTHNFSDSAWFHSAARVASAVCFTRRRIAFIHALGKGSAPTQGQTFFYFGADVATFARRFSRHGLLMAPLAEAT